VLSIDDPLSRGIAAALAVALGVLLVVRSIRKDRREYSRFRRYRSTRKRQSMMRRWLIESVALFGGSALVLVVLAHPVIGPLLSTTRAIPWIEATWRWLATPVGVVAIVGAATVAVVVTVVGLRSARREGGVVMIGDIAALLPRNRPELGWASALSVNAGVSEELLFRWALPALLFVVTGEPLSAFAIALVFFAALHAYQGAAGIIGTALVGLLLTAAYVLSGSILVAVVLHIALDLRTLVLVPVSVYRVHTVPSTVMFPKPLTPVALKDLGQDAAGEGSAA
jgi:uncharacterized protein